MKRVLLGMAVVATCATMAKDIHVDAQAAEGGDGSAERPFASLLTAQEAVRKLLAAQEPEPITVRIHKGDYMMAKPLVLRAEDSAPENRPVVWQGEPGARLVGGLKVDPALFKPVTDEAILARLPEESRGKVRVADVSALMPGTIRPIADVFTGEYEPPHLFMDHQPMTLARWPNKGYTEFTQTLNKGYDLVGGAHVNKRPGVFVYNDPRAKRWNFDEGVWIAGYLSWDWAFDAGRIGSCTNDGKRTIMTMAKVTRFGIGAAPANSMNSKGRRFYVMNVLDELDAPGEWYLDRTKKLLYVYPIEGSDWANADVVMAMNKSCLLGGVGVTNATIRGLTMEYSYATAMHFRKTSGVTIEDCTVRNVIRSALEIHGFRNVVRNCEMSGLGMKGIELRGGNRYTLENSESIVEDCRIHDFGRYQKTYAAGIDANGCGFLIRRNEIFDAPHCAVLYSTNEAIFEYNNVHDVLKETGDAGAYYTGRSWTTQGNILRYNFTHHLGNPDQKKEVIGFYFDDYDCGDAVYGNVFWAIPKGRGVFIGGGRDHPVRGNLFVDCDVGVAMHSYIEKWEKNWNKPVDNRNFEEKAERVHYREDPWKSRYPNLARIMQEYPQYPLYNPIENNVFVNCKRQILRIGNTVTNIPEVLSQMTVANNLALSTCSTNTATITPECFTNGFRIVEGTAENPIDPGFVDAEKGDFRLKKDAWLRANMPKNDALQSLSLCGVYPFFDKQSSPRPINKGRGAF